MSAWEGSKMQERAEDSKREFRTCTRCGKSKTTDNYYASTSLKSGYRSECIDCSREVSKQYPKSAEQIKDGHLKHNYGISIIGYNKLFLAQEGKCAICGTHQTELNRKLNVDHDHKTGAIRGLLCGNCNAALGHMKDNEDSLLKAVEYLRKTKELV